MGGAIRQGIDAARTNLAAVTWQWLASLLASLPFALVAAFIVDRHFSKSLASEVFAARLDVVLGAELVLERADEIAVLGPMLAGALVFCGALTAFMKAAILSAVAADRPMRTGELLAAGGRGFGRLVRLFPLGVIFMVLVVGVVGGGLFKLHGSMTEHWISEQGVIFTRLGTLAVVLLLLSWTNGAYDLMRVEAVAKGEHRARYAFWRGLVAAVRRPFALLSVYLPFAAFAVIVTLVASLVDVRISRTSFAVVVAGFVFQQAIAYIRAWLSVALAGAEVQLLSRGR
jgi:hypothetical protein